jgi:adiponectin receptor
LCLSHLFTPVPLPPSPLPPPNPNSTLYHTVRCISPEHDSVYLRLDVGGIALMIIGSYSVGLHQGFYCEPTYAYAYMAGLLAILSVCAAMMVQPGFQTSAWDFARSASLSSAVCFGLIPAYHWVEHCEWHCVDQVWTAILGMFSCYAVGFVFFFFRIPERWSTGTFDYVGASHQIWHTFVVLAGVFWLHGMVAFHEWRVAHGAHCEPGRGELPIPFAGT